MKRIILLVSIVISLSGCFSEKIMIAEKPLYVETYTVTESVIVGKKYFQGTAVPADLSPLAFRSDGKLKTLAVKSGDKVSKGDVIATLDTTRIEQQLQETKVQAELANKQFNRAETLKHKGMISNAEYDELKATKSLTYIQYRMLQQQMKHAQLIAPFNGTVAVINAENYQNVNALETILSIYRANSTYIDIPVSETLIAQLKALPDARKVKASIQFADKSGEYQAKLKLYSGEPIPELKGYLARFELTDKTTSIIPGTSATVSVDVNQFNTKAQTAFKIPVNLLVAKAKTSNFSVWKIEENMPKEVPVSVIAVLSDGAVVDQGVSQGDILIATQLSKLTQGKTIKTVTGSNL